LAADVFAEINRHHSFLDPLLVVGIHRGQPSLVRFLPKVSLQPQNLVHQFELHYQVVGLLVVLRYRLEDQLSLSVEVVVLAFIQFLPPFLAAGLGKSSED
jgi:hypothetical protein